MEIGFTTGIAAVLPDTPRALRYTAPATPRAPRSRHTRYTSAGAFNNRISYGQHPGIENRNSSIAAGSIHCDHQQQQMQ